MTTTYKENFQLCGADWNNILSMRAEVLANKYNRPFYDVIFEGGKVIFVEFNNPIKPGDIVEFKGSDIDKNMFPLNKKDKRGNDMYISKVGAKRIYKIEDINFCTEEKRYRAKVYCGRNFYGEINLPTNFEIKYRKDYKHKEKCEVIKIYFIKEETPIDVVLEDGSAEKFDLKKLILHYERYVEVIGEEDWENTPYAEEYKEYLQKKLALEKRLSEIQLGGNIPKDPLISIMRGDYEIIETSLEKNSLDPLNGNWNNIIRIGDYFFKPNIIGIEDEDAILGEIENFSNSIPVTYYICDMLSHEWLTKLYRIEKILELRHKITPIKDMEIINSSYSPLLGSSYERSKYDVEFREVMEKAKELKDKNLEKGTSIKTKYMDVTISPVYELILIEESDVSEEGLGLENLYSSYKRYWALYKWYDIKVNYKYKPDDKFKRTIDEITKRPRYYGNGIKERFKIN